MIYHINEISFLSPTSLETLKKLDRDLMGLLIQYDKKQEIRASERCQFNLGLGASFVNRNGKTVFGLSGWAHTPDEALSCLLKKIEENCVREGALLEVDAAGYTEAGYRVYKVTGSAKEGFSFEEQMPAHPPMPRSGLPKVFTI